MDIEELKDIIIDSCEEITPVDNQGFGAEIIEVAPEVIESSPAPDSILISKEQLESNDSLTAEKKKLAAALAAAQQLGIIEDDQPFDASTLADTSDTVIEDLRVDYQVGTGVLSPEEAHESALDRKAARFVSNANNVIDQLVDRIGAQAHVSIQVWARQALDWVEEKWPETRALRPAAEHVVDVLDNKVVPYIVAGAKKIAHRVKEVISAGAEKVKTAAKKVTDFVKGLFS